ncbi:MAG: nicotinate-nucleotide--dimethylbenzimidazole phosphoribosyltransferase [Pseudomonadota bacterium]
MSDADPAPFDDVRALVRGAPGPDPEAADAVRSRLAEFGKPRDFGRLGDAAEWISAWQRRYPPRIENPTLAIFAGSHGIATRGVTQSSTDQTKAQMEALRGGTAPLSAIATVAGANIRAFDLALDQPTPAIDEGEAMSERDCAATMAFGFEAITDEPDLLALGVAGAGVGTAAAAVACALYGGAPEYWVRPGPGTPSSLTEARTDIVRKALALHRGHLDDPLEALRCLGGRELAACAGAIVAARRQSIPVLLDGFATTIAAGVVHALDPKAIEHVMAAHVTRRPAHEAALERIGLEPLMHFDFQTGGGLGSTAAIGLLKAACAPFIAQPVARDG